MPNNTKSKSDGQGESTGHAVNKAWDVEEDLATDPYKLNAVDIKNPTKEEWLEYWRKQPGYSEEEAERMAQESMN